MPQPGNIPLIAPWHRAGWYAEISEWVGARLARIGYSLTAPVSLLERSATAALIVAETTGGKFYCKCASQTTGFEPSITALLASKFSGLVPDVVAVDHPRHWLLMRDLGDSPLAQTLDLQFWCKTLSKFAKLQRACEKMEGEFRIAGLPDRSPANLPGRVLEMLEDRNVVTPDLPGSITADEIAAMQASLPEVERLAQELADTGIPLTLEHGDFHAYNVMVTDGNAVFFDWAESSWSHPFFSFASISRHARHLFTNNPDDAVAALETAYLQPWLADFSKETVNRALHLARHLGKLQRAVIWYEELRVTPIPDRSAESSRIPYWIRQFLERKSDGIFCC